MGLYRRAISSSFTFEPFYDKFGFFVVATVMFVLRFPFIRKLLVFFHKLLIKFVFQSKVTYQ